MYVSIVSFNLKSGRIAAQFAWVELEQLKLLGHTPVASFPSKL